MTDSPVCLGFTCCGVPFRLDVTGAAPLDTVLERVPPGSVPAQQGDDTPRFGIEESGGDAPLWRVVAPGSEPIITTDAEWAFEVLESRVRAHVAVSSPERVFVHAGVVRWMGRTVVMPGPSGSGKSTLVAALVAAGAEYWSDEYAVFDDNGELYPFRRPLALIEPGRTAKRRLPVPAGLGQDVSRPQPLDVVLVAPYEPGAEWSAEALLPGDCALALLAHAVAGRVDSARVLHVLARAAAGAVGWRSPRGDVGVGTNEVLLLEQITGT